MIECVAWAVLIALGVLWAVCMTLDSHAARKEYFQQLDEQNEIRRLTLQKLRREARGCE